MSNQPAKNDIWYKSFDKALHAATMRAVLRAEPDIMLTSDQTPEERQALMDEYNLKREQQAAG